ncbi:hypothetical protein [Fluviicola taffensis]|uniref:hypothetical protein n=1 Tax=Fluviicola taffensis TaxID=191579 RepID=UPI003137A7A7
MHKALLLFILLGSTAAFGQIVLGNSGAQQVFGAVSSVGREVVRAAEYKKTKEEREQRDAEYSVLVQQGDQLFDQGKYREANQKYNLALQNKQEQYVRDQIARCNAELARIEREEYQLFIDKADSLYAQLNFSAAIESYTEALTKKEVQYPKDKIKEAKADQERWEKVHFSGLLISDKREDDLASKAFSKDPYSDFIKPGKYNIIDDFLTYSNYQTLDGIAVPANMHLVIYSEPQFKGTVLVDVVGPAIINNMNKKNTSNAKEIQTHEFTAPLQGKFPQYVRTWSVSDMKSWVKGSMEITTP